MRRWGAILLGLLYVMLGAVGTGALLWQVVPRAAPWPVLIQQRDGNLVLANLRGQTQPLTTDANGRGTVYLHPTPAPDGQSVASVAIAHGNATASASLVVHNLDGERQMLFEQANSAPFYLSWSPDSQRLAFLTGNNGGMTLHGVDAAAQPNARQIIPGQPSYFAWSPDSQRLLLHTGGSAPGGTLGMYEWGADAPQQFALAPTAFQAPIWTADGASAIAGIEHEGATALATIDRSGAVLSKIADVQPGTVFVASPDGQQIAYVGFDGPDAGRLTLVNADGANARTIGDEPVVTAFWSPTGERLAFVTVVTGAEVQPVAYGQQAGPRLRWNIADMRDGSVRAMESFAPSIEFLNLLPYFDQYAQSVRLWNRDGTQVLYATATGVQLLDVESGVATSLGDGVLGLWMER